MISLEPLICDLLNDNNNWKTFFCNKVNENMELDHKKCPFRATMITITKSTCLLR